MLFISVCYRSSKWGALLGCACMVVHYIHFFIAVQVTDELPPPAAGDVQVAVKAVGLNFADGTPSYKQVLTPIPNHTSLCLELYLGKPTHYHIHITNVDCG